MSLRLRTVLAVDAGATQCGRAHAQRVSAGQDPYQDGSGLLPHSPPLCIHEQIAVTIRQGVQLDPD
jgi:hypothetical protein